MTLPDRDLAGAIRRRKRERGALVLAHVYQPPEIQELADVTGDSLALSRAAARAGAPLVVFCGVRFMAETAKILSPASRVVLPAPDAGCPMADMITAAALAAFRADHPGVPALCYVNSSAEVKAGCDGCVTSANAVEVVARLPADELLFVPDRWLGGFAAARTGKRLHLWPGFCPVHQVFRAEALDALRAAHPGAVALVHPECDRALVDRADHALGTGGMEAFVAASPATDFIIGTEVNFVRRLERLHPGKRFHPLSPDCRCADMGKTDLPKLLTALDEGAPEVTLDPEVMRRARRALDRMVETG